MPLLWPKSQGAMGSIKIRKPLRLEHGFYYWRYEHAGPKGYGRWFWYPRLNIYAIYQNPDMEDEFMELGRS